MNVDLILDTFNRGQVQYLLIGGINFSLRHAPYTTFDIDLWIEDSPENRAKCEHALVALNAEWGPTDATWRPVSEMPADWLAKQSIFCLHSPHGSIDIFRSVTGLGEWSLSRQSAVLERTAAAVEFWALCDRDMLECQLALDPAEQKKDRVATLRSKLRMSP